MNARLPVLIAALCGPLVLSHCSTGGGSEITKSSAPKEQLLTYQTYAWSSERAVELGDPDRDVKAARDRIVGIVNGDLESRGLTRTSYGQADLLVSCKAIALETIEASADEVEVVESDAAGDTVEADVEVLDAQEAIEGSLSVDLRDRRTGKDVYRGFAQTTVLDDPSPWQAETQLQQTVNRMMADFPRR